MILDRFLPRAAVLVALVACACLGWASPGTARSSAPVLLVLGDSLSAAYGMPIDKGWVALLEERLRSEGHRYTVVNASISGETTAGGLARIDSLLERHRPALVVIELGGNDGLRGVSLDVTREHLETMIEKAVAADARVVLLGMRLPPNYGRAYGDRFAAIYSELGSGDGVTLVPFFLEGVGERLDLVQADGIHPLPEAQPTMLDTVWRWLAPLL